MQNFNQHNQEFFESLVPKPRPSIRNINILETNNCHSFEHSKNQLRKKDMYETKQYHLNHSNVSDDKMQYTEDEDDSDDQDDSDSIYSNNIVNSSSQNVSLNSSNTAYNHYLSSQLHKRNQSPNTSHYFSPNTSHSRSLNTSRSVNITHNNSSSYSSKEQSSPQNTNIFLYVIACIAFLIIVLIIQVLSYNNINQEIVKTEVKRKEVPLIEVDKMLDRSIQVIQMQFETQKPYIWNDISAAIYDVILYPKKPSIIILFGKEADTLNCLAQLLGQLSGMILGSNDYLILTPKDFPNDVGQVIYDLKIEISQKQAIIIQDLLKINTEAIRAFHNFCDRENPLVEHAIYIITMVVDDYVLPQKELGFVEKKLVKRLSGYIEKDILDPLITRLTDGIVIPILPEPSTNFNRTGCSFPKEQINKLQSMIP